MGNAMNLKGVLVMSFRVVENDYKRFERWRVIKKSDVNITFPN